MLIPSLYIQPLLWPSHCLNVLTESAPRPASSWCEPGPAAVPAPPQIQHLSSWPPGVLAVAGPVAGSSLLDTWAQKAMRGKIGVCDGALEEAIAIVSHS